MPNHLVKIHAYKPATAEKHDVQTQDGVYLSAVSLINLSYGHAAELALNATQVLLNGPVDPKISYQIGTLPMIENTDRLHENMGKELQHIARVLSDHRDASPDIKQQYQLFQAENLIAQNNKPVDMIAVSKKKSLLKREGIETFRDNVRNAGLGNALKYVLAASLYKI